MSKYTSVGFVVLTVFGSIIVFFVGSSILAMKEAWSHKEEVSSPRILTDKDLEYETNYVDNALLDLYSSAIIINDIGEVIVQEENDLSQKEQTILSGSLTLPPLQQPSWFPSNVVITIDDGPRISNGALQGILRTLEKYNVQAYFFFVGDAITANNQRDADTTKKVIQDVIDAGHIIGWHSMHHTHIATATRERLDTQGPRAVKEDVAAFQALLNTTLGFEYPVRVSRMPGGSGTYDPRIVSAFKDMDIRQPTFWHIETETWEEQVAQDLVSYVQHIRKKKDSYIILLHEKTRTERDLDIFLGELQRQGNSERADTNTTDTISFCPKETQPESLDLFPVSHTQGLPKEYTPANLVPVKGDWATYCAKQEVVSAYLDMKESAKQQGLLLDIYSGYRSYQKQQSLYTAWQKRNPEPVQHPAVAKPGHSEHQLGTTIDIRSLRIPYQEPNPLETTEEYTWLKDNAHLYGFVQSYPAGKESVTGYIPEAWHWRYVGVTIATDIKKQGTTITEYLAQYTTSES